MITAVDHIDLRVADMQEAVDSMKKIGLVIKREMPERNSVEMALPGENQVVFEIHKAKDDFVGVHHIAFRQTEPEDVERLKEKGVSFKSEHLVIKATGRTVSSFDSFGVAWQLTD